MTRAPGRDPELDRILALDALDALDTLLGFVPRGERLSAHEIGALVRLIRDRLPAGVGVVGRATRTPAEVGVDRRAKRATVGQDGRASKNPR